MACSCGLCKEIKSLAKQALGERKGDDPRLLEALNALSSLHERHGELSEAEGEAREEIQRQLVRVKGICEDEALQTRADWAIEEYIPISEFIEELRAGLTKPKYIAQVVGRVADFSQEAIDLLPFRPKGSYTLEILEDHGDRALARFSTEIGTHQKAIYILLFLTLTGPGKNPEVEVNKGIVETDIPLEPSLKTEAFKDRTYDRIEIKLLHERYMDLSLPPEAVEALVMGSSWYSELADVVVMPPLSEIVQDFRPHRGAPTYDEIEGLELEVRPTVLGYLSRKVQALHQEISDLKSSKDEEDATKVLEGKLAERNALFGTMKLRIIIEENMTIHVHDHTIQKVTTMPLPHTIDVHIRAWEETPCIARLLSKVIGHLQSEQILEHTIPEVKSVLLPRAKIAPPERIGAETVLEKYAVPDQQVVLTCESGRIRTSRKKLTGELGLREVLVRVLSSAVDTEECEQALHFEGIVPGDKFAGMVVAMGRDVASVAVGDMVVGVPILRCGKCPNCMESGACSDPVKLGLDVDGSHVQYIKLPDENVLRIPRGRISLDSRPDAACLAEAVAIAEHAISKSTVYTKKGIMDYQLHKPILLLGTNMVSLNILQRLLEGYSDKIIVLDHREEKLERLKGVPEAAELLGQRIFPVLVSSVSETVAKVLELAGRRIRMIFNGLGTRRSVEIAYRVMDVYAVLVNVAYSREELGGLHQLIEGKKVTIYDCATVPFDELRFYMEMALVSMSYSRIEPWRFKGLRLPIEDAPPILQKIVAEDPNMMGLSQVTIRPQK